MSLVVITGGLNEQQLSFISESFDLAFGEGSVTLENYELSDISLVTKIRLGIKDASVISVFLGNGLHKVTALSKSLPLLEGSGKFLEVNSTSQLVDYLNSTYNLELVFVEEIPNSVNDFDTSLDLEQVSKYERLLVAKDETILSLQTQLKELEERNGNTPTVDVFEIQPLGVSEEEFSALSNLLLEKENQITDLQQKLSSVEENSSLESLLQERELELSGLKLRISEKDSLYDKLKLELSDYKDKYSSASGLALAKDGRINELERLLALEKEKGIGISKEEISGLKSELSQAKLELSNLRTDYSILKKENLELKSNNSEVSELRSLVQKLERSLNEERSNVVELNRRLLKSNLQSSDSSSTSLDLPSSFSQQVVGSLWKVSAPKFKNIVFLFAGSGDSHREAYLRAETLLTERASGGILLDLSTESVADYRFGVKRGIDVAPWYSDSLDSIKNYLSKTKHNNVFVLSTFTSSYNELYLYDVDLYSRLSYLDSLGVTIVVYGGDISSYFARDLMSSALYSSSVEVVCRSLGTSVRSMYFHSKQVSGSLGARYFLSGKVDEMSSKVARVAKKDGFMWEVLDA